MKKLLVGLLSIGALASAVLYGAHKPETAALIVKPAEAAQCSYVAAMRTDCMGEGCTYPSMCRPSVCPQSATPRGPYPGNTAHKGWMDPPTLPPSLTLHAVSYLAVVNAGGSYPTCNSYFNTRSNWEEN